MPEDKATPHLRNVAKEASRLDTLYQTRFDAAEQERKNEIWKILCSQFFQKYVPENSHVLDLGAGFGEFINHIVALEKTAVDLNPDSASYLQADIRFIQQPATQLTALQNNSIDIAFASNFFEHMPSKEILIEVVREAHRVLRPGGKLLILQPNIRYVGHAYWDFIDHHIALTDLSCIELLRNNGFSAEVVIPRFLPYTTKSALPQYPWLVKLYLSVPILWRLFGQQSFLVGIRQDKD